MFIYGYVCAYARASVRACVHECVYIHTTRAPTAVSALRIYASVSCVTKQFVELCRSRRRVRERHREKEVMIHLSILTRRDTHVATYTRVRTRARTHARTRETHLVNRPEETIVYFVELGRMSADKDHEKEGERHLLLRAKNLARAGCLCSDRSDRCRSGKRDHGTRHGMAHDRPILRTFPNTMVAARTVINTLLLLTSLRVHRHHTNFTISPLPTALGRARIVLCFPFFPLFLPSRRGPNAGAIC